MEINDFVVWGLVIVVFALAGGSLAYFLMKQLKKKKQGKGNTASDYERVFKTISALKSDANKKVEPEKKKPQISKETLSVGDVVDFKEGRHLKKKDRKKLQKLIEKQRDSIVLIFMETANGNFKTFIASDEDGGFKYKNKWYVFDSTQRVEFSDLNLKGYFYSEAFDLPVLKKVKLNDKVLEFKDLLQKAIDDKFKVPIDKSINVSEIRDSIEVYGLTEVENAFDPMSLKRFIDTQVILQVMGGAWFTKIMKVVLIAVLIMAVLVVITLGLDAWQSYMLHKLTSSG